MVCVRCICIPAEEEAKESQKIGQLKVDFLRVSMKTSNEQVAALASTCLAITVRLCMRGPQFRGSPIKRYIFLSAGVLFVVSSRSTLLDA